MMVSLYYYCFQVGRRRFQRFVEILLRIFFGRTDRVTRKGSRFVATIYIRGELAEASSAAPRKKWLQ